MDGDPDPDPDAESVVTDGKCFVGGGHSGEEDSDVCVDPLSSFEEASIAFVLSASIW